MWRNCTPWLAAVAACALLAPVSARGQFASGVTLVDVYATVANRAGGPVTDLRKTDFQVLEEGVPQTITAFASGDFPMAVAVALDRSWSMAGRRLQLAKQAARTFIAELRPRDRAMVIALASDTEVVAPLSVERNAAFEALARLQPWSTSALHDAVVASLDMIQPAGGRRALILLSDGIDRYSRATAADALQHARELDVLVYPISLGGERPPLFAELAAATGGRSFAIEDPSALAKTFGAIADELRHQYLLGYTPTRPADPSRPEWRSLTVKVSRPDVRVRARQGYLAH